MRIRRNTDSVSMTDVAHRAGVSQSTVSRVLSHHPAISDSTRELVQNALRELGYKAEFAKLISGDFQEKTVLDLVMCPLPEQTEPFALDFFNMILQGAKEGAAGTDYRIQTITLPADTEKITEDFSGNGAILLGYPTEKLRGNLRTAAIPYIVVSGDISAGREEDLVSLNNFESGIEGGKYLISRGYRRIGFILSHHNLSRYAGFEYALRMQGLNVRPSDLRLVKNTEVSSFIEIIHHWIREKDLPEAIVVGFNGSANAIETILKLNDIRVPEDVFLLSFDHNVLRINRPCLCSMPYEMGHIAIARLIEKIRKPDNPACWSIIPMTLEGIDLNRENDKKQGECNG